MIARATAFAKEMALSATTASFDSSLISAAVRRHTSVELKISVPTDERTDLSSVRFRLPYLSY